MPTHGSLVLRRMSKEVDGIAFTRTRLGSGLPFALVVGHHRDLEAVFLNEGLVVDRLGLVFGVVLF